ncbi:DUF5696 domain-containing protein [Marinicrinis lubricantis]|uniref:DUF5696 domain-containing protein n=1 Tax=Marinicrinis lubricantis TaxID=2086470 RepID=A0ABW1ILH7_9BACL
MRLWKHRKLIIMGLLAVLLVIAASRVEYKFRGDDSAFAMLPEAGEPEQKDVILPADSVFEQAAETDVLRLKVDRTTGHFIVEDKRNGQIWRSFPDPLDWENEEIGGMWRRHLASPIMFQYMDFTIYNSPARESNFVSLNGTIENVTEIEGGVQWVYAMPELGIEIPVQIRIEDDYVETRIIDSGIQEDRYSLLWVRLFPFFAAEHSADREGYMLIPDGSGAIIDFDENRVAVNRGYQESIYGVDISYLTQSGFTSRYPAQMPIYGLRSGTKAMLAVIHEGAEYSDVFAAPAGLYSQYNWITAQQTYRSSFEQITNRNKGTSFTTYNKEDRFGTDRVMRYYILPEDEADYVGMASRYRTYLMEEQGMSRIENTVEDIPLYLSIVGADVGEGMFGDKYLKATTTDEAGGMLQTLHQNGIGNMNVTYLGWQEDGYSSYGGYFDVDERIGGNEGMRTFVQLAHSMNIPVTLGVNYDLNNTGVNGFRGQYDAIRDMAGTIQEFRIRGSRVSLASARFILDAVEDDLSDYEELQVDGLLMLSTGGMLASDYNNRLGSSRTEAMFLQKEILQKVRDALGRVEIEMPNFYAVSHASHIHDLADDYSYDLFSRKAVPFAQIALHGLVTYTSSEENERQQYTNDFLKDIEFGAYPSFVLTASETDMLTEAYGIQLKSSQFDEWEDAIVTEYERYNAALAEVQNQFIVDHRMLAQGVMATTYENGTTIVVNYTDYPYLYEGTNVAAMDYAVLKGADGN